MSVTTSYPEAAFGLRALFRGLPGVVRRVIFTCNLLRTGCIRCGVGPHSVYDCPFVDALEANQMSLRLYKQWSTIIGEELMIFGVASSSANYMDAAISRISARSDLPRRRPRRMKITHGLRLRRQRQLGYHLTLIAIAWCFGCSGCQQSCSTARTSDWLFACCVWSQSVSQGCHESGPT